MGIKMKIRKATIGDTDIIAEYNYRLAKETENKMLDKAVLKAGVGKLLEDENKGVYYVCEIDGKVVGQIMYTYEWSDWRNGLFLWIQSVYVDAGFRKQGVFKALYNAIKVMCDNSEGIAGLRLYVEKENDDAQRTYEALGMKASGYLIYEYEK